MKKIISLIMACLLTFCVTGCNNNIKDNSGEINPSTLAVTEDSKVLIVYFSHSNNTHKLTEIINSKLQADVIRLTPADDYEEDTLFERAQSELNDEIRPEISNLPDAETVAGYDTILVGFPIWWYDLPMPVWTFLEEYDLSGKTIIPYFTHKGSSGGAGSLDTIEKLCPDSTVLKDNALSIPGSDVENSSSKVDEWLKEIGLKK